MRITNWPGACRLYYSVAFIVNSSRTFVQTAIYIALENYTKTHTCVIIIVCLFTYVHVFDTEVSYIAENNKRWRTRIGWIIDQSWTIVEVVSLKDFLNVIIVCCCSSLTWLQTSHRDHPLQAVVFRVNVPFLIFIFHYVFSQITAYLDLHQVTFWASNCKWYILFAATPL